MRITLRPVASARRAAAVGVIVASSVVLAACSGSPSGPGASSSASGAAGGEITGEITLQTWSLTPKFTDYLDGVIAAFEKQHPGAKVTLLDQPGDGYSDKVLSQAASGTLPDVVNLPPEFAFPLAKQGLLTDVSLADPELSSTYVEGALGAYTYPGVKGVYAYPWYLNTDIDYWNSEQMSQCGLDPTHPPVTTDDLFTQAAVMHDKCPDNHLMSRKPQLLDFARAGIEVLSSDGTTFTFNTPEAAALLDRYAAAYQGGLLPSAVLNDDYLGNSKLFTQGDVAWTTGGAGSYADFVTNNPSLKGNIVVSPALDVAPLYVQGLAVSAKSAHPATADAFARFMTNAENQNAFAHLVNIFPSTTASSQDSYFTAEDGTVDAQARVTAFETLKTARLLEPVVANDAMKTVLAQQIALAMKGDETSKQALDNAVEKMNQMLADS